MNMKTLFGTAKIHWHLLHYTYFNKFPFFSVFFFHFSNCWNQCIEGVHISWKWWKVSYTTSSQGFSLYHGSPLIISKAAQTKAKFSCEPVSRKSATCQQHWKTDSHTQLPWSSWGPYPCANHHCCKSKCLLSEAQAIKYNLWGGKANLHHF